MDPGTARVVERLVRDALAFAQAVKPTPANGAEIAEHRAFLGKVAGSLAVEEFERPAQGTPEAREEW